MTLLSWLVLACAPRPGGPGGSDTPPDDSAPPTDSGAPSICPSGLTATDAPVLWTIADSEISFLDGTGASQGVFSFDAFSLQHMPTVERVADRIGVLGVEYPDGAELALVGLDGSVLSRATIPGAYESDFWLGGDLLAYSPGHESFDALEPWMDGVLLGSEGKVPLAGWIPKGPVVDGVLPVCAIDGSACAWLDVATGDRSGSLSVDAWWTGNHLVWIDGSDLVVASPASDLRVDLGVGTVIDWNANAVIVGVPTKADAIVSLATGERIAIGSVPEGWRPFTDPNSYCPNADWKLTSDDRVLAVLRNDQVGQVWAHDPATGSWDPLGLPVADVVYVGVWEQDGTVQIGTVHPDQTFCLQPTFEGTADSLVGSTVQVLRTADGIHYTDPDWAVHAGWANLYPPVDLYAGGTCALSSGGDAVVDLLTGESFALAASPAGWLD